ncbi:kinase-like domain-containing protein [Fomes fomentarius]|nr:kinase-like domain-containing protein [Fomes fomentarius]
MPGWIPSWMQDPAINMFKAEDAISWHALRIPVTIDARRKLDGKSVLLKKVRSDSEELRIASYLSSDELRRDPRNHCVPILDVLTDPKDPTISYLIMPFLRSLDHPEFETVGNIFDCVGQLLEGLVFLHKHNIAHRDCAYKNVMMDATSLFPQSFHPVNDHCLPDRFLTTAPILSRATVPVTYHFTDFGISTRFASEDQNRLVTGTDGLDREVPELSDDVSYDPFKVDIFLLGNLFRTYLFEKFSNVDDLVPLIRSMVNPDPRRRPTAVEAYTQYQNIRSNLSGFTRIWRARPRHENWVLQIVFDALVLFEAVLRILY